MSSIRHPEGAIPCPRDPDAADAAELAEMPRSSSATGCPRPRPIRQARHHLPRRAGRPGQTRSGLPVSNLGLPLPAVLTATRRARFGHLQTGRKFTVVTPPPCTVTVRAGR
jgi:hypothetical protein